MREIGALVLIAYGVGVGIWAERNDVPAKLGKKLQAKIDAHTRHTAQVMTDAVAERRKEVGM